MTGIVAGMAGPTLAILLSLAISMVFYLLIGVVAVGPVGASGLSSSSSALSKAINATGKLVSRLPSVNRRA